MTVFSMSSEGMVMGGQHKYPANLVAVLKLFRQGGEIGLRAHCVARNLLMITKIKNKRVALAPCMLMPPNSNQVANILAPMSSVRFRRSDSDIEFQANSS